MKKTFAIMFTVLSLALITDSFDFGHALMMFYLAGIVPGTNISIDASSMLEFFALIAGFIVARLMMAFFRTVSPRSSTTLSTQPLQSFQN
jgi:hypothetical protein